MNSIKKRITIALGFLIAISGFISCETENEIGTGIVTDSNTEVFTYKISLNGLSAKTDTIRTDDLTNFLLGVNKDPIFGTQKSGIVSNVTLSSLNPKFDTLPELDSVYIAIKVPVRAGTQIQNQYIGTLTDEEEALLLGNDQPDGDITFKKFKRTYRIGNLYGKEQTNSFQANVYELSEKLVNLDLVDTTGDGTPDTYGNKNYFSDYIPQTQTLLGNVTIQNQVDSIVIVRETIDASGDLITRREKGWIEPMKIVLDKDYFTTKIIDQEGSVHFHNQSQFQNYFRGIYIETISDEGFMLKFSPADISMVMKYTYVDGNSDSDNDDDTTDRIEQSYVLGIGDGLKKFNVMKNLSNQTNSDYISQLNIDPTTYDFTQTFENYFISGGVGNRILFKIQDNELEEIKIKIQDENWNILDARIELYLDDSQDGILPPQSLYLYEYEDKHGNVNTLFDANKILDDYYISQPLEVGGALTNSNTYKFNVTSLIKNLTENQIEATQQSDYNPAVHDSVNKLMAIEVRNQNFSNLTTVSKDQAYSPTRAVFIGNQESSSNIGFNLIITYTK